VESALVAAGVRAVRIGAVVTAQSGIHINVTP
jgi:hypothetical protein